MECLSCKFNVDLKWKYAIDNNICPNCGKSIMEQELKNNLSLLREVMDNLKNELPSLESWLYDSYGLLLGKSDLFLSLMPKQKNIQETVEFKANNIGTHKEEILQLEEQKDDEAFTTVNKANPEVINKYFDNAEVRETLQKQKDLKDLVSQIKAQNASQTSFSTVEEDFEDYAEDYDDYENDLDADIPPALLAKANGAASPSKDMALLKKLQNKSKSAASRMRSGGGGFSR